MEDVSKADSDRDGIADEKDPNPQIAEIYIVQDSDFNGIDDEYDWPKAEYGK